MSYAEATARQLYDSIHLDSVSNDVKRQLMILILSNATDGNSYPETQDFVVPHTLEEAVDLGAVDLESARKELHSYADGLTKEYDLK